MEKEQNSSSIDSVSNKEIEPIKVHSPPRIRSPLRVRCDLYSTASKFKVPHKILILLCFP